MQMAGLDADAVETSVEEKASFTNERRIGSAQTRGRKTTAAAVKGDPEERKNREWISPLQQNKRPGLPYAFPGRRYI